MRTLWLAVALAVVSAGCAQTPSSDRASNAEAATSSLEPYTMKSSGDLVFNLSDTNETGWQRLYASRETNLGDGFRDGFLLEIQKKLDLGSLVVSSNVTTWKDNMSAKVWYDARAAVVKEQFSTVSYAWGSEAIAWAPDTRSEAALMRYGNVVWELSERHGGLEKGDLPLQQVATGVAAKVS